MKLKVASVSSNNSSQVIQTGLQAYGFCITRDNKKLCYTKRNDFSNLWSFTYNERSNLFQPKKLTEGTSLFGMPNISPEGSEIAIVNNGNIFKMSIDGNSMKQLTFLNSTCRSPSWSLAGKEITFISGSNLAKVFSNGATPKIFENTTVGGTAFWISDLEVFYNKPGNRNFYIFNLITQENNSLVSDETVGYMFQPRLSPDKVNLAIYYNRQPYETKRGLWIISRKDSSQKLLLNGFIFPLEWSADSRWIYALNSDKTPPEILMINSNTGVTKVVYSMPSSKIYFEDVDITPSGKTIVCAIEETNSDVWMIENFDPDVE